MSAQNNKERATIAPPVDIFENKDEILILADLPGVTPEGLKVSLENDQLTIDAQRPVAEGRKGEPLEYKRVFVVPHGIDADKIGANLQAGVLRLTLPKPAALKPRQIEVRAG